MIECLIIGDSIAVGVGMRRHDCEVEAKIGITSNSYLNSIHRKFRIEDAEVTVISLGSNDGNVDSYPSLLKIRQEIKTGKVIWIMSTNNKQSRFAVLQLSFQYGDQVLDTSVYPMSKDGVHPTAKGYEKLAESF